jgi:hypothetical protein
MNNSTIYSVAPKDQLDIIIIDKIVEIMYKQYDNELSSFQDFIYRQKKLPNIITDINNSQYISIDSELRNYKNFISKNFNNDKDAIDILYFTNNEWTKYDIPQSLVYNIYKIKYLSSY